MAILLPPIDRVAYRHHETDDHPAGGYCLQIEAESIADSWDQLIGQHQRAFELLADAAEREVETGWVLTRPVLFAAHHVCELALKLVIAVDRPKEMPCIHPLPDLRKMASRLDSRLSPDELDWITNFIGLMDELTHKGFEGRYLEIDSGWCCVALEQLRNGVGTFVSLCTTAAVD